MSDQKTRMSPETAAIHAHYRPELSEGAVKPPIFATSTFVAGSSAELAGWFRQAYGLDGEPPGNPDGLIYSRLVNPNLEIFEKRICEFESAGDAALFASGMAAIVGTVMTFCRPGDTVMFAEPLYGGTDYFMHHVLPAWGVRTVKFDVRDPSERLRAQLALGPVRIVFVETPSNPTLMLADIPGLSQVVRSVKPRPLLVVDNTILGPRFQSALDLGADLSVYSATKSIGGHSDLIAGVVLGKGKDIAAIKATRTIFGSMNDPHTASALIRSLETYTIRADASMHKAKKIVEWLSHHPLVKRVFYPGFLEDDRQMRRYHEQCSGSGSLVSFLVNGGQREAYRVLDSLRIVKLAVSLGGTESLAEHPATHTHSDVHPEDRVRFGITEDMIRLSIGLEDADDIISDLAQALATISV